MAYVEPQTVHIKVDGAGNLILQIEKEDLRKHLKEKRGRVSESPTLARKESN